MKKVLVLLLVLGALIWWRRDPPADWAGLPAAKSPLQDQESLPPPFTVGEYTLTPLARYALTAVVLGTERYRHDRGAEIAPVDLALGWGPVSAASVINELRISQSGRWYEFSWGRDGPPLDPAEISRHSANTHCVPSSPEIRDKLLAVRRHQLVALSGYLVEISRADGYRWRSSLTRDDVAGGSCEVVWITRLAGTPLPLSR